MKVLSWSTRAWSLVLLAVVSPILLRAESLKVIGADGPPNSTLQQQWTGTVSCAAKVNKVYSCGRYDTLQSCAIHCVQSGSNYVLVVVDSVYGLVGSRKSMERFAGGEALVTGIENEGQIKVISMAPSRKRGCVVGADCRDAR